MPSLVRALSRVLPVIGVAVTSALFNLPLSAQWSCQQWAGGYGLSGTNGYVRTTVRWDPDGTGPVPPVLVLAGNFTHAGTAIANRIAIFEPVGQAWSALGNGMNHDVWCLATTPGGELLAAGSFTLAGSVPAARIARWTGVGWAGLGSGLNGTVYALALLPNGDLIAGGEFTIAGGQPYAYLARWNGSTWSPLGSGTDGPVYCLTVAGNGDLVAGGNFSTAGGQPSQRVARWNGSAWSALGSGLPNPPLALATMPTGEIVAGGRFFVGPLQHVVWQWNGSNWSPLGGGLASTAPSGFHDAYSLAVAANGTLLVGGSFHASSGFSLTGVARWNGSSWTDLAGGWTASVLDWPGLGVVAGGQFELQGATNIARHDGTGWRAFGRGTHAPIQVATFLASGDCVLGGNFQAIGGLQAGGIVRTDGTTFTPLGSGVQQAGGPGSVLALLDRANGELIAGGTFTHASGVAAANIARWNGTTWAPLGAGLPMTVMALAELANGDLVAGGTFMWGTIGRWNGTQWVGMNPPFSGPVRALHRRPGGELIAAGDFVNTTIPGMSHIASWNGVSWQPLGNGLDGRVHAVASLPDGSLLAGGEFTASGATYVGHLARWNGSTWSTFGSFGTLDGPVRALAVLPNGEVVLGGSFTQPMPFVARVTAQGPLCQPGGWPLDDAVTALAADSRGDVVVGGSFLGHLSGSGSAWHARLVPTFAATASPYGSGCTGSGGPLALAATQLPWLATTFASSSTGNAANALVVDVLGLQGVAVPLASLLPQGVAGCSLLASPDLLGVVLPTAGVATSSLPLPNDPWLIGAQLRQQHVCFELGALGIQTVAGTNGLLLTIGAI